MELGKDLKVDLGGVLLLGLFVGLFLVCFGFFFNGLRTAASKKE